MFSSIWNACKSIFNRVKASLKKWTKPATVTLAIELIKQMARENPGWGTKKIHGELLKLAIVVDKRTIRKCIRQEALRGTELAHLPEESCP